MCQSLDLQRLGGAIKKTAGLSLNAFFTGKTHKVDCPFKVVISEGGTWERDVGLFIAKNLNKLELEDPFYIKSSESFNAFLFELGPDCYRALSLDFCKSVLFKAP